MVIKFNDEEVEMLKKIAENVYLIDSDLWDLIEGNEVALHENLKGAILELVEDEINRINIKKAKARPKNNRLPF